MNYYGTKREIRRGDRVLCIPWGGIRTSHVGKEVIVDQLLGGYIFLTGEDCCLDFRRFKFIDRGILPEKVWHGLTHKDK